MNKIILKCFLAVFAIFLFFIPINYFVICYMAERSGNSYSYDMTATIINIILNVLQIIFVVAAGVVIKHRNKGVIDGNINTAKKYLLGSLIFMVIVVLMLLSGIYTDLYYITSATLKIFDESPALIVVCWEQFMDGKFIFELLLCISIGFMHKIKKEQEI